MLFSKLGWTLIFSVIVSPGTAIAQLRLFPIQAPASLKSETALRTSADRLQLPFWDDFSYYSDTPDTSLWMSGSNVVVNPSRGLNPPSLGVATFDGATASGGLYNNNTQATGLADSLVSKPINLGTLSTTEINSVYFSFFWQHEGAQEMPDPEDSLRLSFRDLNNEWIVIDVFNITDVTSPDTFQQVLYKVGPEFLHNDFQFKFEGFGRLSGPYDSWHIDYVYLNKGRQVNDRNYFDRAITSVPASLFNGYTAVPAKQFFANPQTYLSTPWVSIYNLDDFFQPIEYSAIVYDHTDPSRTIAELNFNTPLNPILQGHQRRTLNAAQLDPAALDPLADSIYMDLEFYITSGDSILPSGLNYRLNDTTSSAWVIHDYFAYDDGTAEFGAGLEQNGGKVAYMFVVDKPDFLNRVDISFINIGRAMENTPFNFYVWKSLTGSATDILGERENQTVARIDRLNQFQSIRFQDITVVDTFYVGWEQLTPEFLVAGLDKSNDTGTRMYYNVDGAWRQNTELKGSLMIRPYFSSSGEPVAIDYPAEKNEVRIFPNPASGKIQIGGISGELKLFHISGKPAGTWDLPSDAVITIDISGLKPGIYIMQYIDAGLKRSAKIIISE